MPLNAGDAQCLTGLSLRFLTTFVASGCVANDQLRALCHGLAVDVVQEITTNAVVIPSMVAPPGGGPVTGTGTIT